MSQAIFITGTGTNVGKTFVTALLVKKFREQGKNAGYYKAVLSGAEGIGRQLIPGDAKFVCDIAKLSVKPSSLVSYIYKMAVSPHLAAHKEGNPVTLSKIQEDYKQISKRFSYLFVEGSGGIVCPLRIDEQETIMLTDVITMLDIPMIIVSDTYLGSINRAVLTATYAKSKGIKIKGFIFNSYDPSDEMQKDNCQRIEQLTGVPTLGYVYHNEAKLHLCTQALLALFEGEKR